MTPTTILLIFAAWTVAGCVLIVPVGLLLRHAGHHYPAADTKTAEAKRGRLP